LKFGLKRRWQNYFYKLKGGFMLVTIASGVAVNTDWVLAVKRKGDIAIVWVGRPGGSAGPQDYESEFSYQDTIDRLNQAPIL
jgi:hypothetical protein